MQQPDNETNKVLSDQEKVHLMVRGEGWGIARKQLTDLILSLQNVNSITGSTATAKEKSMEVNKKVSETLYQWLVEIEGTADQFDVNKVNQVKDKPYIVRVGNP